MISEPHLLRRLGFVENWDWPLLYFALPFYILFATLFDAVFSGNGSSLWAMIFVIATAVEVLVAIACKKIFVAKIQSKKSAGVWNLATAGMVNVASNITVAYLGLALGLLIEVDWIQRIIGAFVMGVGLLFLYVSLVGSRIEHSKTMSRRQVVQGLLLKQRQEANPILKSENERLLQRAQALLLPRIEKIEKLLSINNTKADALFELKSFVADQVRPLSAELSSTAKQLSQKLAPNPVPAVDFKFMTEAVRLKLVIRPGMVFLLVGTGQWLIFQTLADTAGALGATPFIAAGLVFLVFVRSQIPEHIVVKRPWAFLVLTLLGVFSGLPSFLFAVVISSSLGDIAMFSMLLIAPVIGILSFAVSASLDLSRADAEKKIARDNFELAREAAFFEQRMWLAKRNWTFVIHGTVQAALTAAIFRLSSDDHLEINQTELALQDLRRARDALLQDPNFDIDLGSSIAALENTWRGICAVSWNASERAKRVLVKDPNSRMCVNEIAKEAVSNAVRHGNAKNVQIEVDRSLDEFLIISISNDGQFVRQDSAPGLGSKMLEGLTLSWSLANHRDLRRVVLTANLPVDLAPPNFGI